MLPKEISYFRYCYQMVGGNSIDITPISYMKNVLRVFLAQRIDCIDENTATIIFLPEYLASLRPFKVSYLES